MLRSCLQVARLGNLVGCRSKDRPLPDALGGDRPRPLPLCFPSPPVRLQPKGCFGRSLGWSAKLASGAAGHTAGRQSVSCGHMAGIDFSALTPGPVRFRLPSVGDPGILADSVASLLSTEIEKKQQLLETSDVVARLEIILDLMKAGPSPT